MLKYNTVGDICLAHILINITDAIIINVSPDIRVTVGRHVAVRGHLKCASGSPQRHANMPSVCSAVPATGLR
jgi:hypothetical protein